jgi:hypothetical protein
MNNLQKNVYVKLVAGDADTAILEAIENKKDFDPLTYLRK